MECTVFSAHREKLICCIEPRGLEIDLNTSGFLSPPLRRGCRAESNKVTLPRDFGATRRAAQGRQRAALREVKHRFRTCLTSPRCAVSKVAFHFSWTAHRPLLRGGDKNPPPFRCSEKRL